MVDQQLYTRHWKSFRYRYSDEGGFVDYGTREEAEAAKRFTRSNGTIRKMKVCEYCDGSHELGQSCGCCETVANRGRQ
jgi:hypothetical protein